MLFYPAAFPSNNYFREVIKQGNWKIITEFTYQKSIQSNRYVVPLMNKDVLLTIPLKKYHKEARFDEIEISYAENWIRVHLGTLRAGYGKAPYFEHYYEEVAAIFEAKPANLISFCLKTANFLSKISGVRQTMVPARELAETIYESGKTSNQSRKKYLQVFEPFRPHCEEASVLDLLFNKGIEKKA